MDLFKRGKAKLAQEDWTGAIADFSRVIELKPGEAAAFGNRGIAKAKQGNLEGATADFNRTIELKPDYAAAFYNRGIAKAQQGNLEDAIADYDRVIELKPGYANAFNNRGIAKTQQGDWKGALADFSKAIELKPDYAVAFYNRGAVKIRQDNLEDALVDLSKAIELKPDPAEAYNARGIAKEDRGDLEGAIADFSRAIELKPDYADAFFNRGNIKQKQDDLRSAISDYNQANKYDSAGRLLWLNLAIAWQARHFTIEKRIKFFEFNDHLNKLLVTLIKDADICKRTPMHYTDLDAMRNLAEGEKFRLYNSMDMDGEEGTRMLGLLDIGPELKKRIRGSFSDRTSSTYIGSLVADSDPDTGDDLMWRTYGRHKGLDRAGCALVFKDSQFPKDPSFAGQASLMLATEETTLGASVDIPKEIAFEECYLYPVCYEPRGRIAKQLKELGKEIKKLCEGNNRNATELTSRLLDRVRFLFKHKRYQREEEVRMIIWRAEQDAVIKTDGPRQYIECPLDIKDTKILLGPETRRADTWKQWLEKQEAFDKVHTPK